MVKLALLGASGSIGRQALEVCRWQRQDIKVIALSGGGDWRFLAEAAREFRPALAAVAEEAAYAPLKRELSGLPITVLAGEEGLAACAAHEQADTVLAAISGMAGLKPLLAAIQSGKRIALANKEALVAGGELVMRRAAERGVEIFPVDSEHSALAQCLAGENRAEIRRLILTASGGAFRDWSRSQMDQARAEDALRHPNWRMGPKITVDCATLVNKALEVIEAHWLFGVDYQHIDIVVHPESIIHSLAEFTDGSVKAQLGWPDMRLPIQYALLGGRRPANPLKPLDLAQLGTLHFSAPDRERFPALDLMLAAGRAGGTAPAYLNAVNEAAVQAFLRDEISFPQIALYLERALRSYSPAPALSEQAIFAADAAARAQAMEWIAAGRS